VISPSFTSAPGRGWRPSTNPMDGHRTNHTNRHFNGIIALGAMQAVSKCDSLVNANWSLYAVQGGKPTHEVAKKHASQLGDVEVMA